MYDAKDKEKDLLMEKDENKRSKYILDRTFYSGVNSGLVTNVKSNYVPDEDIFK